jgi:hypothetical protein
MTPVYAFQMWCSFFQWVGEGTQLADEATSEFVHFEFEIQSKGTLIQIVVM